MAYRLLVQLGITYGAALGRAVVRFFFFFSFFLFFLIILEKYNAWRSTAAASNAAAGEGGKSVGTMSIEEAQRILNVSSSDLEQINAAFERMYDANSPEKGNSFYLQSKVYRAREALLAHLEANNNDADLDPPNVSSKQ